MEDVSAIVAGAAVWALAIPLVRYAGPIITGSGGARIGMLAVCAVIAAVTTPAMATVLGWRSRAQRIRGVALALGAAQTIDGLVFAFYPALYVAASNTEVLRGVGSGIMFTAGLTGIASAYT